MTYPATAGRYGKRLKRPTPKRSQAANEL